MKTVRLAPRLRGGAARPRFALFGGGLLGEASVAALAGLGSVERISEGDLAALDTSYALLTVATDEWDTSAYPRLRRACAKACLPWLPVRAELGTAVVGPLERPGVPGCVQCMHIRRQRARLYPDADDALWHRHSSAQGGQRRRDHGVAAPPEAQVPVSLSKTPSSWLTGLACDTVGTVVAGVVAGAVVAGELARVAHHPDRVSRLDHAALFVDLERLTVTSHRFLPEPLCPECGRLPDDTPELAELTLVSRPKPTPGTYRVRPVADELDTLVDTYVDDETGMIRALNIDSRGGLAVASAPMPLRVPGRVEHGFGRTRSYRTSELVALLEALERWGGLQPGGKRTVVHASYSELTGRALDPRTLGLHPAESYRLPGFGYRPFGEEQVCRWVWGYSFARQAPILVPESVAYYSTVLRGEGEERPFAYEISNGCALGSCVEEAILYGILEVAERDGFLLTWYARMPVPRIDLHSARDRAIPLQAAAITAETGYQVLAYDITLEQGIPCVWAMAVSPDDDPGRAMVACAGGSHLDPETAVLNTLSELGPILADVVRRFPGEAGEARRMVADPTLVTRMSDHSLLYSAREAFGRLDFLTTTTGVRGLADMHAHTRGAFGNADLREDLGEIIRRYLDSGMDVVVVDQTTPEHRAGGFACVKVIIPGTVPMTFGHHNRRVDGLPRLYEVPHRLGYRPRPLSPDELNPHPHPFP
jgi:ribosomal protein S12 methylthiotransferase accessory factor